MKEDIPTLNSEAKIAKKYYLEDIFGDPKPNLTAQDGIEKMLSLGNHNWVSKSKEYYNQSQLRISFHPSPLGKIHEFFHIRTGSAHTANWEQLAMLASDIFSEVLDRKSRTINFKDIKELTENHLGVADSYINKEYRAAFYSTFKIDEKSPFNSPENYIISSITAKSIYAVSDLLDKHGINQENFNLNEFLAKPLNNFKPENFMFKSGILTFDSHGAYPNIKMITPDTNLKALYFAVNAVNKLSKNEEIKF